MLVNFQKRKKSGHASSRIMDNGIKKERLHFISRRIVYKPWNDDSTTREMRISGIK
jgi:hypothetical protein